MATRSVRSTGALHVKAVVKGKKKVEASPVQPEVPKSKVLGAQRVKADPNKFQTKRSVKMTKDQQANLDSLRSARRAKQPRAVSQYYKDLTKN